MTLVSDMQDRLYDLAHRLDTATQRLDSLTQEMRTVEGAVSETGGAEEASLLTQLDDTRTACIQATSSLDTAARGAREYAESL